MGQKVGRCGWSGRSQRLGQASQPGSSSAPAQTGPENAESYAEEEVNMAGRFNRGARLIGACFVMIGCMANPSSTQTPDSSSTTAVLVWTRDGGFAGFCDEMKILASGAITTSRSGPTVFQRFITSPPCRPLAAQPLVGVARCAGVP